MKDIAETGNINLASQIANSFTFMDISEMQKALADFVATLPSDNLTQWHKDKGILGYTSQAIVLNGFANAIDYQIKNQNLQMDKIVLSLKECQANKTDTEFWNNKVENNLERLAVIEHNLDTLEQVFLTIKKLYAQSTGDDWRPYVKPSEKVVETATALELDNILAKFA
jgi:hypothetical protein